MKFVFAVMFAHFLGLHWAWLIAIALVWLIEIAITSGTGIDAALARLQDVTKEAKQAEQLWRKVILLEERVDALQRLIDEDVIQRATKDTPPQ